MVGNVASETSMTTIMNATMDRVASSSQLSSELRISSTSSLPSLASQFSRPSSGSIADSDGRPDPSLSTPMETMAMGNAISAADGVVTSSRPQRPSPFRSFRSLKSTGPFNPLGMGMMNGGQLHIIAAISLAAVASASEISQHHRRLEDAESEWTGEWNGEWQAAENDDINYECAGDNCNDDDTRAETGMWLDSADETSILTPEQIITYVSVGLICFMTLLCCVCYPEILVVGYAKMCGCCGLGPGVKAASGAGGVDEMDAENGGEYMGGRQEEKKKKRRKSKSRDRSSSRTKERSSRDVELV